MKLVEKTLAPKDATPKALACYGLLLRTFTTAQAAAQEKILLRFAEGNPRSALTIQFLEWCCAQLEQDGKRALVLIWDNASWHNSQAVHDWITAHNRQVKQTRQGIRIVSCSLPTHSPWLNPIEPMWKHGKQRVLEPDRVLSAPELSERVYATFEHPVEPFLTRSANVS